MCDVCCERVCALHFLTFVVADLFVSNMVNGKGYDVVNFEKVMQNADPEKVMRKQPQLCKTAKDLIGLLPFCDSSFSSIFNYHERAEVVDPVGRPSSFVSHCSLPGPSKPLLLVALCLLPVPFVPLSVAKLLRLLLYVVACD